MALQLLQRPMRQEYSVHAAGLQARCRAPCCALMLQSPGPPAAPNGAEQNAARPAIPPPHCALQPPHGPYCHCALLQAFVLRDKHSASVRRHVLDANDAKFTHCFHAVLLILSNEIVM